ncbi:putative glicosidase [Kockovaella imperatae]|uniref:Putative glicosidase n=1 Tax=Kockovaella imperatae TaxID=4999 RepID=A0A1Y1UN45_9TREE|nr:putative glicosidase [Kockovaella imperatae]ORX38876.1 putative glicosidase [Kockovaella imperatae]
MPVVERDLTDFVPACPAKVGQKLTSFTLVSTKNTRYIKDFSWTLEFPLANAYRILLHGPTRPRPPHDNVSLKVEPLSFEVLSFDEYTASFAFPQSNDSGRLSLRLSWRTQIASAVFRVKDNVEEQIMGDVRLRSYGLTEHGIIRHYRYERDNVHLGLGEKAAPLDLSERSFTLHAADVAGYDTYKSDPLYKHTPFLVSTPRPGQDGNQGLTYAIFHGTNSVSTWDIGRSLDIPSGGYYKTFTQDWGGLEEWVMLGDGVQAVVKTLAEITSKPKLVGRDWLGYLASTMLLADLDNAQEELEKWPELCKQHDIPCSAMHLSSGFTCDEKTGQRWVFYMNKHRYPDFKGMIGKYHEAGMKVVPNIKPYVLKTHPAYKRLLQADGLFHDPFTGGPATQNIWASGIQASADGSWVDLSAKGSREWWCEGVEGLVKLGCDGMWDDNSEYFTRDDEILFKNDIEFKRYSDFKGPTRTGLMGRITGNELMNRYSHATLQKCNPERRTYVLTRSGNVAAFKYACSTWSGDNFTSWQNLRGSQHIQLNSSLSLMQSYGSDIGGFVGPIPSPELFVRWVQLGMLHSRFCIHSAPNDGAGHAKLNTPWMYPQVLPLIRAHIKQRYELLPYFNHLMWESHLHADPTNAPLFYGPFRNDAELYTSKVLDGFQAWCGVGRILQAPAMFEGQHSQEVYFPKSSNNDESLYFDLHAPHGTFKAGTWSTVGTPIDHGGMFVREGTIIPIGHEYATVTSTSGAPRTNIDGIDTKLMSEGGVVGLDDWRGVLLFPGKGDKTYTSSWIEDDGISSDPTKMEITVTYTGTNDQVRVAVTIHHMGYEPLWKGKLHFILPEGDDRKMVETKGGRLWGERRTELKVGESYKGRATWQLDV